jgi:hypothetical protein
MIKNIVFLFSMIFALSGCVSILSSEIPNNKVDNINLSNDLKKRDMTFSINYFQEGGQIGDDFIVSHKDIKKKIKDTFKLTGVFRKIKYVNLKDASEYHYHFNVVVSGPDVSDRIGAEMLTAYTLAVFPMHNDFGIDISMQLYVNGEETYGISAPQRVRDLVWLPFFFTWPFFNHATTGHFAEKKAINFFANEIIKNKLYEQ